MIISVDVDAPARSDRQNPWIVGGIVAAIAVGLLLLSLPHDDPTPRPTPSIERAADQLTLEQQTYLVYSSWLTNADFAQCMGARGFSREAVASLGQGRINAVSAFLGVKPQEPQTWLAPAEARNGRPASDPSRASDLALALEDTGDGGCQGQASGVDPHNARAVGDAVSRARADAAFTNYLAERVWFAEHPASALLYQTHLMIDMVDPQAPRTSDRWSQQLASVMALVDGVDGWSEGPSEGYADFAQAVAIAPDGSMVVIRVGDPSVIESGFVSTMQRPMIDCGDVGVVWGVEVFLGSASDAAAPYTALRSGACVAAT
jgi:hypothetical protein